MFPACRDQRALKPPPNTCAGLRWLYARGSAADLAQDLPSSECFLVPVQADLQHRQRIPGQLQP